MSGPSSGSFLQVSSNSEHQKVKVVAGYALQQKLGSGSFATVYKGVRLSQTPTNVAETVAIKAITRTSEKLTKKVLQNLEIEISILRTYRHPNIVCLHDVQKTARHFYLILEYCAGGDLQGLIRRRKTGRLSEGLTRRLMRDLSAGLKFLWGQELIHRDIKPQNLLLTSGLPLDESDDWEKTDELEEQRRRANFPSQEFGLKIADFGFARHLQTTSLAETLCGSPLYMAPEILQHHRYDAKADLWSVGTVLFEMICGRPPFNGENHIDLLRNIQRKAVRLPPDVRVSKECVNLLRLLLNRNPLSRAGFKEFFEACDAFVALGCNGIARDDKGSCERPSTNLGTIPENEGTTSPTEYDGQLSDKPSSYHQQSQEYQQQKQSQENATEIANAAPYSPAPSAGRDVGSAAVSTLTTQNARTQHGLTPLIPSPPSSSQVPVLNLSGAPLPPSLDSRGFASPPVRTALQHHKIEHNSAEQARRSDGTSSAENSFVMVEHGSSLHKSPTASTISGYPSAYEVPPHGYFVPKGSVSATRGDYMLVKQPKGMLSTSPGTGGALMGMLSGRARILYEGNSSGKHYDAQISMASKMLAASEDVGRRAISVAHLGDNRAYLAMRMVLMNEHNSSLLLSAGQMEGIVEETVDHDGGTVTDDSSSTEITASIRRRRSSSATDKSMPDVKEDELDEMPFVFNAESPPLFETGMPSRTSTTFGTGVSITSPRHPSKATPAVIRAHFEEALSCYLKGLKLLKGSVGAAQRVAMELESVSLQRLKPDQLTHVQNMKKRCEVTATWLGGQFSGVLERADAATTEIRKLPSPQTLSERNDVQSATSAEELIYNHSCAYGRQGAVKQLLGQNEAARSSYRSAGLLAETLLMETNLGVEDRAVLEEYVDGFADRITELDDALLQQSRMAVSSAISMTATGSRRGSGVVSLVTNPSSAMPNFTLGANPL
jgi:serine/threonine-protein kinase ULK/ATG1